MGIARSLICSLALLLSGGVIERLAAEEDIPFEAPLPAVETETTDQSIPEPNTLFFAGIGGLTLLLFAIRRKA